MALTIREQVLAAFATRLSAERSIPTRDRDDLPVIGMEAPEESGSDSQEYGKAVMDVPVNVVRYVRANDLSEADTEANAELGTLIQSALGTDNTLGGLCRDIRYTGGAIDLPPDGSVVVGVAAQFTITYSFDEGDPFTDS